MLHYITVATKEGATTFTNWDQAWGMVYKYPCYASIKNYDTISEEENRYLFASPCLFGRKFTAHCKIDDIPMKDHSLYNKSVQ